MNIEIVNVSVSADGLYDQVEILKKEGVKLIRVLDIRNRRGRHYTIIGYREKRF